MLLTFGFNSMLPGLAHGCGAETSAAAQAPAMDGMHHGDHAAHQDSSPSSDHSAPCHCVGHSCCEAVAATVNAQVVVQATLLITTEPRLSPATAVEILVLPYLLPYPAGPPLLV